MAAVLASTPLKSGNQKTRSLPRLENGDRLTRAEFERRYQAMADLKKAELIEGVVYVPSPTRASHARYHSLVIGWLATYVAATPGVDIGDNATVRLDADNEVQPDVLLRIDEKLGGSSSISVDDYFEGPPELVVEIAASSVSYDLHDKLNVYRRNGVAEYIVWRIHDGIIDWFVLQNGLYLPLPDDEGRVASRIFPGLTLNVSALLAGDLAAVLETQQEAQKSEEHRSFAEQLLANAKSGRSP